MGPQEAALLRWNWLLIGCIWLVPASVVAACAVVVRHMGGLKGTGGVVGMIVISVLFFGSFFAAAAFAFGFLRRARQRDLDQLRKEEYRVCLHCRFDLKDLSDSGVCPECGNAYEPDQLRRSWEWKYAEDESKK